MADYMKMFREWVSTIREDVDTMKKVVEADKANADARRYAAAALNYVLSRMDLVPDWEESIGVLDDVLVMRALAELVVQKEVDDAVGNQASVGLHRLANEADQGREWLGDDLWGKFRKHAIRMTETPVRGRSPDSIVADGAARKAVYAELDDHIKKMPAHSFSNADLVARKFKSYVQHKLK